MQKHNKSLENMEIAIQRKTERFVIQHVHKVSNQSDNKEVSESDEWLYSEEYSVDNRGHKSVMISGLLGITHCTGNGTCNATPKLQKVIMKYYTLLRSM